MERHKGSSILEILLVLAVAGVLVIMAVRYFSVVDLNMRVASAISKIDLITRASYQWRDAGRYTDFDRVNTMDLATAGLISSHDIKNPWGGIIEVGPGKRNDHVQVHLNHISKAGCISLSHHLAEIAYRQVSAEDCAQGNYYGDF